ncbi:hypothetical protein HA402_001855 [Bradysia odoriphaga]|nr:hypothetical protein HA402_001855 [Bradysia odoriphaga]
MIRKIIIVVTLIVLQVLLFASAHEFARGSFYTEPPIPQQKNTRTPELGFVTQRLDNFDPTNNQTWQMRYFRNDEFFANGGPILIFVGGQWGISGGLLQGGQIYNIAEELSGQMFYTEHRYYGLSRPTPDVSVENLRFLTSEQATADLAYFIEHIRQLHPEFNQSEVILIGGAYAGSIVTWTRQRYPHLVAGAWASSATVFANFEFIEYNEVVGSAFNQLGGENCFERLSGAFSQAEQLISEENFTEISNIFRICENINFDDPYDVMEFFTLLLQPLTRVVQYHRDGDITEVCTSLLEVPTESDIQSYGRWFIRRVLGENPLPNDCVDFHFESDIQLHRNISWESTAVQRNDRQWFFQTCREFGWFRTTGSTSQPFGSSITIDYYLKFCSEVFGDIFTADFIQQNIRRTNVAYGGLSPAVKNVYFTHGSIDPWHPTGILTDFGPDSPVDLIPGASHWQDLGSDEPSDSTEIRAVRQRATNLIKLWSGVA